MDNLSLNPEKYFYATKYLSKSINDLNNIINFISDFDIINSSIIDKTNKIYEELNNLLVKMNSIKDTMMNMDDTIDELYEYLEDNYDYDYAFDMYTDEKALDTLKSINKDTSGNISFDTSSILDEIKTYDGVNNLLDLLKGGNLNTGGTTSINVESIIKEI